MFKKIILSMMLFTSPAIASDMKVQMLEPTVMINDNCSATLVDIPREGDYLLTAKHCVKGSKWGYVNVDSFDFDKSRPISSTKVYFDVVQESAKRDLALLKLRETIDVPRAKIADILAVEEGSDVWAVGYPAAMSRTITKGLFNTNQIITTREAGSTLEEDTTFFRATPAISGGNSGGGLYQFVDNQYELIGVTSMGYNSIEHMSVFVRLEDVRKFLSLDAVKPKDLGIDNQ